MDHHFFLRSGKDILGVRQKKIMVWVVMLVLVEKCHFFKEFMMKVEKVLVARKIV